MMEFTLQRCLAFASCPLLLLLTFGPARLLCAESPLDRLPGTAPLEWKDDIASRMVDGIDRFLLTEIDKAEQQRSLSWRPEGTSPDAYDAWLKANRKRLAHIAGVPDDRKEFDAPELITTAEQPSLTGRGAGYEVHRVRWPVIGGVHGEGLLLLPTGRDKVADVIAIPDADQTPEQLIGLAEGTEPQSQYARRLAESGCRVLVPMLINRQMQRRAPPGRDGGAMLSNREYLYRPAFILGRHLIGYELQKVFSAVDWLAREGGEGARIGVAGWGEGGLLALHAAVLDERIDATAVSGYFGDRRSVWREPLDRNVFGLLQQFGDAELAAMVAPRMLIIEAAKGPELTLPSEGGAPARLLTPLIEEVRQEFARAKELAGAAKQPAIHLIESGDGSGPTGSQDFLAQFLSGLSAGAKLADSGAPPENLHKDFDAAARHHRQLEEIERHTQALLEESPYVRADFLKKLDVSSLEKHQNTVEPYRELFRREVIGQVDMNPSPPNPRSRKSYGNEKWTGYEVVLDVFPDVFAYGILLVPKDIKEGERRPVVVCQHGLEGRPQDVVAGDHSAYHDYAAKLAERGFVVFAPQNPYIFKDRFRTLQRKANPLGKTLFSVIVPQHQQIVDWLETLPYVDGHRIAFYGLSYGGKTAMRVPALVPDYCLSICSADFNDWVWKNASTRSPYSYVWTGEYEIFEFDLGSTFNYADMAALIAPRPFMVERGHFDGVAPDERVAYEFAKVRHLYAAKLGIPDRCRIEWFVGPHTINGKGTFDFLHEHLKWPKP